MPSAIASRTRMRGSSEASGSWNTICIARRYGCSARASSRSRSTPSNHSFPACGSTRRSSERPIVDLPQPDSPTSASVRPAGTSRSTPSTARTQPTARWNRPLRIGNQTRSPSARSSGDASLTVAAPAPPRGSARRAPAPTTLSPGASEAQRGSTLGQRVEKRQPAGRSCGVGTTPAISARRSPRRPQRGHGAQQPARVGMARAAEHLLAAAFLDETPGVHHGDAIRELVHHAEIVRDQQDRGAELALEVAHQLEDLRLDRDVERGGRLVGDQQLRPQRQRHRDHHALLEARRRARADRRRSGRPGPGCRTCSNSSTVRRRACARESALVQPDRLDHLRADRQHGIEARHRLLEDHRRFAAAHAAQLRDRQREHVAPGDADAARTRCARASARGAAARAPSPTCRSPTRRPARAPRPARPRSSRRRPPRPGPGPPETRSTRPSHREDGLAHWRSRSVRGSSTSRTRRRRSSRPGSGRTAPPKRPRGSTR